MTKLSCQERTGFQQDSMASEDLGIDQFTKALKRDEYDMKSLL